jgi:hypothetical protein
MRGVYGKPWSELAGGIPISKKVLNDLGKCLVDVMANEAKKDFARRGWSGVPPGGGTPIWKSFSYKIRGKSTVEILSTFPDIERLMEGVPKHPMTWLTQEAKDKSPNKYKLTDAERKAGMIRGGKVSDRERRPLVIPVGSGTGTVVFRMAPLKIGDAWIHPGIARFTFMERAIKKGRKACADILGQEIIRQLSEGDPLR